MKKVVVLIVFGLILFVSCSTLGTNKNTDNSHLLIMTEVGKSDLDKLHTYYNFLGKDFSLTVNPKNQFNQFSRFSAKSYEVTQMEFRYIQSSNRYKSIPWKMTFTLYPDTITIYSSKVHISLNNDFQSIQFIPLSIEDYKKCEEYISKQKKYEGLKIIH